MGKLRFAIGEHDFAKMRERNAVYVDKTQYIAKLLDSWDFFFLSRPRRFGKSLFLNTLDEFFSGHKELFKGLYIENYNWDWQRYPVIRINLAEGDYHLEDGLSKRLFESIVETEQKYSVRTSGVTPREKLRSLMETLKDTFNKKVVILIDEYEKPLLDSLNLKHHGRFKEELNSFYSTLKNNEKDIRFLFITGVTRFGHLNIFSGLNNLRDISLEPEFNAICGITGEELESNLKIGIEEFAASNKLSYEEAVKELKKYYDGYHFSRDLTDIYNPYSLLTALQSGMLDDFWMTTGNSSYLLERLKESDFNLFELVRVRASASTLRGIDPDYTDPVTLLYQSGYLTIKEYNNGIYELALPNHEVRTAMYQAIIPFYLGKKARLSSENYIEIGRWIQQGEAEKMMEWLQKFFSKITYDVKLLPKNDRLRQESDFQFMVYAILSLVCGLDNMELEYTTSNGRIDLVVKADKYIYIFEFKIANKAQEALEQINSKGYALSWKSEGRTVIKIGVACSPVSSSISEFIIER